ncbi:MAG: polysaccharide pyruvyl transferase family protein [Candidatus Gracilibacteria bacterium]
MASEMIPRSILIVGNYGAGNLGDDAILGGIVAELRSVGYEGEIQITHGGVIGSTEIYKGLKRAPFIPVGLRSRFKKNRKAALETIARADLVILGGGGLFTDEETWRAPLIWATQAKACRKLKKPYLCFGQSVGPLRHLWSRHWAKKTFKGAAAVHVRDQISADLLKEWGLEATVGTDPAFSWLLEQKRTIPRKPILLVSLREWPDFGAEKWRPLVKEIQVFAKKKKLKPILMSMQQGENLKAAGLEIYEPSSALAAFEAMEKAQMAVTMRLHAGIFAIAAGTPVAVLSYSQKVKALLDGTCTVLSNPTPETLREALKTLSKKPMNLEKQLIKNQQFLKKALN